MYELDVSSLWAYLQTLFRVAGGVLRLDPQVFITLRGAQTITGISLGVVVIAGLMRMLGQSIVLFANRVRPKAFVVRILADTLLFIVSVLLMGVIVWIVARLFNPGSNLALGEILRTVPLAYAPYWLGALVLAPYLGIWIERGLKVYVFMALVVLSQGAFNQSFFNALFYSLIAWFSVVLLNTLLSRPLTLATDSLARSLAGGRQIGSDIYQELYQIYRSVSEPNPDAGQTRGGGHA